MEEGGHSGELEQQSAQNFLGRIYSNNSTTVIYYWYCLISLQDTYTLVDPLVV